MKRVVNQATVTDSSENSISGGITTKGDSILQIHTMAAVFYEPDSMQLDSFKKANRENYEATVQEMQKSQDAAVNFLKKKNIKIFISTRKYFQFAHDTGDPYTYQRKSLKHLWGMFLYDRDNPPVEVDMNMVEFEYLQYFVM